MTRISRIIIVATLLLTAAWLHLTLCTWRFPISPQSTNARLAGWGREYFFRRSQTDPIVRAYDGWGLFAQFEVNKAEAATMGVAIPFVLVAGCVVLILRWRSADRAGRGLCPKCGHQLDANTRDRCPECGWQRPRPTS